VSFDRARALIRRVPAHVGTVGVFVDPDEALLTAALATGIRAVQLHKTAPDRAAAIRMRVPVWAAVAVKTRADVDLAAAYKGAADCILYDAKTPEGAALPGGMGLRFDWKLLENLPQPLPWALSGGLDAGNLREAVGVTGAKLVDVSSGVESAPGVKDVAKIAAFLKAVAEC
jgi:phosphoribosylanthranilate isomerase